MRTMRVLEVESEAAVLEQRVRQGMAEVERAMNCLTQLSDQVTGINLSLWGCSVSTDADYLLARIRGLRLSLEELLS